MRLRAECRRQLGAGMMPMFRGCGRCWCWSARQRLHDVHGMVVCGLQMAKSHTSPWHGARGVAPCPDIYSLPDLLHLCYTLYVTTLISTQITQCMLPPSRCARPVSQARDELHQIFRKVVTMHRVSGVVTLALAPKLTLCSTPPAVPVPPHRAREELRQIFKKIVTMCCKLGVATLAFAF